MQDIVVVEKVETYEDKYKKYAATGCPERFIKMDEEHKLDIGKYTFANSLDKMVRLTREKIVLVLSPEGVVVNVFDPVFVKRSGEGPLLLSATSVKADYAILLQKQERKDFTDYLLSRNFYEPPVNSIKIVVSPIDIFTCLFRPPVYRAFVKFEMPEPSESVFAAVAGKPANPEMLDSFKVLSKIFEISPFAVNLLANFSRDFFMHALAGVVDESHVADFKKMKKAKEAAAVERNRKTMVAIKAWIIKHFELSASPERAFNKTELKILNAGKNEILNKFVNPDCEHLHGKKASELKLINDFMVCPHGNQIKCRHRLNTQIDDVDKFLEEFGMPVNNMYICKYCGAKLIVNPKVGVSFDGPKINTIGINDDIRKYIYRRCRMAISYVAFNAMVTEEYVAKLAGNVSNNIIGVVNKEFYKIDKFRGVSGEFVTALKEIIVQIYVFCAYLIASEKSDGAFAFKGQGKDKIKRVIEILENMLKESLDKVKSTKEINVGNLVYMVMDELHIKPPKVPQSFFSYDIKETITYKLLKNFSADMSNYPDIKIVAEGQLKATLEAIVANLKFLGFIGTPDEKSFIVFSEKFIEHYKMLRSLTAVEEKSWESSIFRKFIGRMRPVATKYYGYKDEYLGYIIGGHGGIHVHNFNKGYVDGKIKDFKDVELKEKVSELVCGICGKTMEFVNLNKAVSDELVLKSKIEYFEIYCPVNFQHKFVAGKCEYCNYIESGDNSKYYAKNSLPDKYLQIQPLPAKADWIDVKKPTLISAVKAKYVGKVARNAYYNFWAGFGCYEDVTYNQFMSGMKGSEVVGIGKIRSSFAWLASLLARIQNIKLKPDSTLQAFVGPDLRPLIGKINEFISSSEKPEYENYRNKFIEIFNELPENIATMVVGQLMKYARDYAKSEESDQAAALISYKTKEIYDHTDMNEGDTGKKADLYEGFDYDGKNEK